MKRIITITFQLLLCMSLFSMGMDTVSIRLTLASPCEEHIDIEDHTLPGNNGFSLYPNPGKGIITLACAELDGSALVDLNVHNILGEFIYSATIDLTSNTYDLDLSGEEAGVYIVTLRKDGAVLRRKLVIY